MSVQQQQGNNLPHVEDVPEDEEEVEEVEEEEEESASDYEISLTYD